MEVDSVNAEKNLGGASADRKTEQGWKVLNEDERKEFLDALSTAGAATEIERLRSALLRVARFSHAKDFSHHGVAFEQCDKQSCAEARADVENRNGQE